jgi:DNA-binding IclR family transcriptional regulator
LDANPTSEQLSETISVVAEPAEADGNSVRSVDRAVSLLLALGDVDSDIGVTEIARSLGLHKSTASRLLSTLEKRGLVDQDLQSGRYRLGVAMISLGGHAEKMLDLQTIAWPEIRGLARLVKATTTLGSLEGDSVLTIAWADGSGMAHRRTARNLPLHATAPGKVLLSNRPEREVIRLSKVGFTSYTAHTIVRLDVLLEELARVRRRGFATAFGENEPDINAVAVPVFDYHSSVVAALEVRASGNLIQPSRVPELIEAVRNAAAAITARIGGVAATA